MTHRKQACHGQLLVLPPLAFQSKHWGLRAVSLSEAGACQKGGGTLTGVYSNHLKLSIHKPKLVKCDTSGCFL